MTEISLKDATVQAEQASILCDVSVQFRTGELAVILGPNGAGKTTLMLYALGLARLNNGIATIDHVESHLLSSRDRALKVAYLPQARPLAWPLTVKDTVALGRFAHGAALGRLAAPDDAAVHRALAACHLLDLQGRRTDTLSGGELARVHCARAFAAEAPLLLADEPVVSLDPKHQFLLLQMIRRFVDGGRGAVVILHDPALAARFADRLVWMLDGKIVADGSVEQTLTEQRMVDVYRVKSHIEHTEDGLHVSVSGALE
ncbi:MAG: ABC transporter ATP-binding protein [Gammaproteobacteria bacterium]|nr:ABC transporter ATP-binding protein [Gammaproteobacteria bacterium]